MLDILKNRHKAEETICIYTKDASFTGKIVSFEENCIIISSEEGEEYIPGNEIKRISIPQNLSST